MPKLPTRTQRQVGVATSLQSSPVSPAHPLAAALLCAALHSAAILRAERCRLHVTTAHGSLRIAVANVVIGDEHASVNVLRTFVQSAEEAETPALFAAMAATLDAVTRAAADASLLAVARFLISLRADAVDDETGR